MDVNMNATAYKHYHESYMQNNHGSSSIHTFFCIFFTVQCSLLCCITSFRSSPKLYIKEYLIIVLPLVLVHTCLSNYIYLLNAVISILILRKVLYIIPNLNVDKMFQLPNIFPTRHINSISLLRSLTYLITVFCIIAVDFQVFPRPLAKTEKFGYSLMDTGVGLFVLMSGLVHKDYGRWGDILRSNAKLVCILVVLGVARTISVAKLDYQQHVTEYGVHWNFFFTLATCKLFSSVILYFTNKALISSTCLLLLHEFFLCFGLQDWVFSKGPRDDFLSANKEGITSSLGYIVLYLFAVYVKTIVNNKKVTKYRTVRKLILISIWLWFLLFCVSYYKPVSRTLANAGYCIYLSAILVSILAFLYVFEVLFQNKPMELCFDIPQTLLAINQNGLSYFLASNLLTGFINMNLRTLFVNDYAAVIILNFYMVLTIILAICFKKAGLKI